VSDEESGYEAKIVNDSRRISGVEADIRKAGQDTSSRAVEPLFRYGLDRSIQPRFEPQQLTEYLAQSVWHALCCTAVAQDTVGKYSLMADGEATGTPPPLAEFFNNCNPDETFTDIMRSVIFDLRATGNGYLEVVRVLGKPVTLNHLPAFTVRLASDPEGGKQRIFVQRYPQAISRVFFKPYGDVRTIAAVSGEVDDTTEQASEVIWFKSKSPLDYFYGVPGWLAALRAIIGSAMAQDHDLTWFESDGFPAYVVLLAGGALTQTTRDTIEKFLKRKNMSDSSGRALVLPLPPGITAEFKPMDTQPRDGRWHQYMADCRDQIIAAHGVLPKRIGVQTAGQLGNPDEEQTRAYADGTIEPLQESVEAKLTKMLIGDGFKLANWRIEFAPVSVPDDSKSRADTAKLMYEGGLWSAKDARAHVGIFTADIDGGNVNWQLSNKLGPILLADVELIAHKIAEGQPEQLAAPPPVEGSSATPPQEGMM
jgi:Phage portal protein